MPGNHAEYLPAGTFTDTVCEACGAPLNEIGGYEYIDPPCAYYYCAPCYKSGAHRTIEGLDIQIKSLSSTVREQDMQGNLMYRIISALQKVYKDIEKDRMANIYEIMECQDLQKIIRKAKKDDN